MAERDYVLGTHDAELERLGLQHRLWRARVLEAWRSAGIIGGQRVLDVGAGPGYASLDLAEIVGPEGRVYALERSRRFLDALAARAKARGLAQVEARELDVVTDDFATSGCDAAWCRWVLCFVSDPRRVIGRIHGALRPGGVAVFHEYVDYRSWRMTPRLPELERFVEQVIATWRAEGGEPDVGADLTSHLVAEGFEIESTRLHAAAIAPSDPLWGWPLAYVDTGAARLVELGRMTQAQADALGAGFARMAKQSHVRMVLPMVIEVIARRTGGARVR
jgi:SAM-dependent methyltransferase